MTNQEHGPYYDARFGFYILDFDFSQNLCPYERLLYLSYLDSLVGAKGVGRSYWVTVLPLLI